MHVCECVCTRWVGRGHLKIELKCLVLDVLLKDWTYFEVYQWGNDKELREGMTEVTELFCRTHPQVLERSNRRQLLIRYGAQDPGVAAN
jgi:hypothetical protein